MLFQRCLVPARAVFAAATDVGDDVYAAAAAFGFARQPAFADAAAVAGGERDFKAAVAVEQGRVVAVGFQVFRTDDGVGDLGAVVAGGEVLFDGESARVKVGGQGFQGFGRLLGAGEVGEREGGRLGVTAGGEPDLVAFVGIDGSGAGGADVGYAREFALRPVVGRVVNGKVGFDVFEGFQDEVVFGPGAARERGVRVRGEERGQFAFARHPVVVFGDEVAARRPGFVADGPVFARADDEPVAHHAFFGGIGDVNFHQFAVGQALVEFVVVEVDDAHDVIAFVAGGAVVVSDDAHIAVFAPVNEFGLLQRGAACPQAGFARVAGAAHTVFAKVGLDKDVVFVYPAHGAFGGGAVVAVFDEFAFFEVVFAGFVGVGAAVGEADEAAAVVGAQALGAVPDPGGVFRAI